MGVVVTVIILAATCAVVAIGVAIFGWIGVRRDRRRNEEATFSLDSIVVSPPGQGDPQAAHPARRAQNAGPPAASRIWTDPPDDELGMFTSPKEDPTSFQPPEPPAVPPTPIQPHFEPYEELDTSVPTAIPTVPARQATSHSHREAKIPPDPRPSESYTRAQGRGSPTPNLQPILKKAPPPALPPRSKTATPGARRMRKKGTPSRPQQTPSPAFELPSSFSNIQGDSGQLPIPKRTCNELSSDSADGEELRYDPFSCPTQDKSPILSTTSTYSAYLIPGEPEKLAFPEHIIARQGRRKRKYRHTKKGH